MGKRKGFNQYTINGDVTTIHIVRRNGECIDTVIDTYNLDKLIDMDVSWHAKWNPHTSSYYVKSSFNKSVNQKTLHLHSFLIGAKHNETIDHIDHDSLNNRMYNLRKTTCAKNTKHRKSRNTNNTSGYRNVSWSNSDNAWLVQLQVNGKNKVLGKFDYGELEEAGKYANQMREQYYGKSKGER